MTLRVRTKTSGELVFALVEAVGRVWDARFISCVAMSLPTGLYILLLPLGKLVSQTPRLSCHFFFFFFFFFAFAYNKIISCFKLIRQTVYSLFALDKSSFIQYFQLDYQIRVMHAMLVLCVPVIYVFSQRGQQEDRETN